MDIPRYYASGEEPGPLHDGLRHYPPPADAPDVAPVTLVTAQVSPFALKVRVSLPCISEASLNRGPGKRGRRLATRRPSTCEPFLRTPRRSDNRLHIGMTNRDRTSVLILWEQPSPPTTGRLESETRSADPECP